jgi:hypothetical protein
MAQRLGLPQRDVAFLESVELRFWEVRTIRGYLEALGFRLKLLATSDGRAPVELSEHERETE